MVFIRTSMQFLLCTLVYICTFLYNRTMNVVSITDGRKRLGELVSQVKYQKRVIPLGKHGKVEALLVAIPDEMEDVPIDALNAASPSFRFLAEEPDLYSHNDLK